MRKKSFARVLFAFAVSTCVLFASGKKESEEISVEDLNSWEESFSIDEKSPGKYNIMVTAQDKGGNTTIVGPYNIYIDPDSDLPVAGITNPREGMRVPGNLNIVGTCVDDDSVGYVEIILDGNEERPLRAEGKEFWSYFLNTGKMAEGLHTIAVTGVDINGTRGETVYATWNLDRTQPVTEITNYAVGELVSGKIKLEGMVNDGNGIKTLEYSLDGGTTFEEIDIDYDKREVKWTFSLTIDTRELEDGAQVCWFRAEDTQGTVGVTSYLFFVDNTSPEVVIVTPEEDESVNGVFQIAGSAYDIIGLSSLSWEFEKESGEFELIPGNPYWFKEFDIRDSKEKKVKFTITVQDKAGNITKVSRTIPVDREADLPVVQIVEPEINPEDKIGPSFEDEFYLRGVVSDDDGVSELHWFIDKEGEEHIVNTEGVFFTDIFASLYEEEELTVGEHKLSYYGVDINGTAGKTVSFPFSVMGTAPALTMDTVTEKISGKNTDSEYVPGMELHPERNGVLKGTATSDCGLNEISWKINGNDAGTKLLKSNKGTSEYEIPLDSAPWGLVEVEVTAVDVYERSVTEKYFVYRTNLTKNRDSSAIVFSDSTIEDGAISFADTKTVSGYFTGGKPVSVRLEPDEGFAKVRLQGNSIVLTSTGKAGLSSPTKVIVTTDKDLVYESKNLTFKVEVPAPQMIIDQTTLLDGFKTVFVSGRVAGAGARLNRQSLSSASIKDEGEYDGSMSVEYRLIKAADEIGSWKKLTLYGSGDFFVELPSSSFDEGITIIEFASVDSSSKKTIKAAAVKKVSPLPEPDPEDPKAKPPVAAAPSIKWIEGEQLYFTCYYQDVLSFTSLMAAGQSLVSTDVDFLFPEAGAIPFKLFPAGKSNAEVKLADVKNKNASLKTEIIRPGDVSLVIDSVDGRTYTSGMQVELPAPGTKNQTASMKVLVTTGLPVTSCTYTIGDSSPVTGKVQKVTGEDGQTIPNEYEVNIPLKDMEAVTTEITAIFIVDKAITTSVSGTISVVRAAPEAGIDDKEKVYWIDTLPKDKTYKQILGKGENVYAYVNVSAPYEVEVKCAQEGLSVSKTDKTVYLHADKDGFYEDVYLAVTDSEGIEYESGRISFLADSSAPTVKILSPKNHEWLQETVTIDIEAHDGNGIRAVEYSIYDGKNWKKIEETEDGRYTIEASIKAFQDGLLPLDVRVTDEAGRTTYRRLSMAKDTQAPVVTTVLPEKGASVNGKTLFVVRATDNGRILNGKAVLPVVAETAARSGELDGEDAENVFAPDTESEPVIINFGDKTVASLIIGSDTAPLSTGLYFSFTDAAGNVADYKEKQYSIDLESDKPRVEIHLPEDDTILITDFSVSGIIYDDDGDSYVWYSIDDAPPVRSKQAASNWSFDVDIESLADNEHTITVFAEDILGVRGDPVTKIIKVSREEPQGAVVTPTLDESLSGRIAITGTATDGNGIKLVQISIDNGNTWQDAVGKEEWSYSLDTRVVQDGTHVVFLRVWDGYDIQGLYSSLVNIDNTAPNINLELPVDDSCFKTGTLTLSGYMTDNVGLEKLYVRIRNMDPSQPEIPADLAYKELDIEQILHHEIDISALPNGVYNVEITGEDAALNVTRVSRNVSVDTRVEPAVLNLLYPLDGDHTSGNFNVYGNAETEEQISNLSLLVDGKEAATTSITETGYYMFELTPERLTDGVHTYVVRTVLNSGAVIYSAEQHFTYTSAGPWVTIDGFTMGDFAIDRPYITGHAGYNLSAADLEALESDETSRYERKQIEKKSIESIEISLDNGKSFQYVGKKPDWKYRVETSEFGEGMHHAVIRVTMVNGETAITRTIFQIDKTTPSVKLITPTEGGKYNDAIEFAGLSSDDVALKSVTLALRSGDKSNYEIPSFIQGLYLDAHVWGVTLFDVGLGLTFFDDNVKLQFQYGQMMQSQYNFMVNMLDSEAEQMKMRYGGHVFGAKLLANIASIPFSYFFGPDLAWLNASFALGANFSLFTETQSNKPQILSAVLGQIEFPKATFKGRTSFSAVSFYTEVQVWFIPTDVESGNEESNIKSIIPQLSFGLRLNIF